MSEPQLVACPKCKNQVDGSRPCPFCAYAESIGLPEELVTASSTSSTRVNFDFALLNAFVHNKFVLQKALENNFVPEMLELEQSQRVGKLLHDVLNAESKTEAWDKLIIRGKLKSSGALSAALDQFLSKVLEVPTPSLEQVISYLKMAKGSFALRVLRQTADQIEKFVAGRDMADQEEITKFVASGIDKLHSIQKLAVNKRITLVKTELDQILDAIEARETQGEVDIIGFSISPFTVLNQTLSGLRKGFLYCLAGAPRRGKTNLALDIATYCARENRVPVLFFTFEQTKSNLTYRLLSKESYLNPGVLQRKRILADPIWKAKLADGVRRMSEYRDNLYVIESTKEDTIDRIRGHAYNVMQEHDTNDIVIFIDYIQKMPLSQSYNNEKFKVEEISTSLKGLSIELNCPIFAISSLSKEGCTIDEKDDDERPSFFHCKGSGDIEYDVDSAMVIGKDWGDTKELYEQLRHKAESMNKDSSRLPKVDIVNLYVDKNRDAPEGILGIIQYFFFIEENKYIELGYKLDTDVYRFNKIETLVQKLIERDFIRFYDHEEKGRQGQFDKMAAQKSVLSDIPGMSAPDSTDGSAPRKRIRLKY